VDVCALAFNCMIVGVRLFVSNCSQDVFFEVLCNTSCGHLYV
jgi:hypothetical protein